MTQTDGPTDQPIDIASLRVASTRLKIWLVPNRHCKSQNMKKSRIDSQTFLFAEGGACRFKVENRFEGAACWMKGKACWFKGVACWIKGAACLLIFVAWWFKSVAFWWKGEASDNDSSTVITLASPFQNEEVSVGLDGITTSWEIAMVWCKKHPLIHFFS